MAHIKDNELTSQGKWQGFVLGLSFPQFTFGDMKGGNKTRAALRAHLQSFMPSPSPFSQSFFFSSIHLPFLVPCSAVIQQPVRRTEAADTDALISEGKAGFWDSEAALGQSSD